jgi:hypothetical protein
MDKFAPTISNQGEYMANHGNEERTAKFPAGADGFTYRQSGDLQGASRLQLVKEEKAIRVFPGHCAGVVLISDLETIDPAELSSFCAGEEVEVHVLSSKGLMQQETI